MATQTATAGGRQMIVDWFENNFKEAASKTTKTARLEDGRVSYSFSVINDSGMDFSRFSFKVKVLNKADKKEIGTATINAGEWSAGEKKTFKSNINIPEGVSGICFVMFSESLSYDGQPAETDGGLKDIGDFISGDGGMLGELFGTGGMPETGHTTTKTRSTTTTVGGTTTKTTKTTTTNGKRTTTTTTTVTSGNTGKSRSYAQRKSDKKLNKMRTGKSSVVVWTLVLGIMFLFASFADTNTMEQTVEYLGFGGFFLLGSLIYKLIVNKKGKRIRFYEANVKKRGNTPIDELAIKRGAKPDKVADELQQMIADGFFPEAYIDINNGLFVMTENGEPIESIEDSVAAGKKARRKAAREKGQVPDTIEDLMIMTDDAEIKAKLKSLKAIQDKVAARIVEVPNLEKQVKDYEEKYYPEVVRLTDEYNEKIANLDAADNDSNKSGLEINASQKSLAEQAKEIKEQLIKMIDLVIEASENLLERLHEDDINDISTDIKSLQATLASKGLLDSDFDVKL
ncbi:MAG: hypothetical protein KBS63_01310 [Clostridiales bacterium]|nr:hypothetical protein [Candidatus Crickella caballi]